VVGRWAGRWVCVCIERKAMGVEKPFFFFPVINMKY